MLEVKDAKIAVGGKTLVENLSFAARDGRLTCITGEAGSGKTTLLRTLMGFLPVEEGFVSVDGELLTIYSSHAFRSLMVYLPQEIQLLGHELMPPAMKRVVAEEFGVWNSLLPSADPESQAEPLSAEQIFQLEKQTILQAEGKQIIIADEPAAHLTEELTHQVLNLLKAQAAQGKTVLIASRNPLLISHADEVLNLK